MRISKYCLSFLILLVGSTATAGLKPVTLYGSAGLAVEGSDTLRNGWKAGYTLEGGIGLATSPITEIVARISLTRMPMDKGHFSLVNDGGTFEAVTYGADLKLNIGAPLVPVRPYFLAGAGLVTTKIDSPTPKTGITDPQLFSSLPFIDTKNRIYISLGAGFELRHWYFQGRLMQLSIDGITYSYFPFSIGLKL
ncbi:MAG: hypothetical protein D6800_11130 [Candidatus Zixiibacteriota bacterium]|nr:MAG: hypothetical protein D6800_11130 [candidate division Zixibacteria bacterium]